MKLRASIITIVRSGQPAPYADSEYVAQITFQRNDDPEFLTEQQASEALQQLSETEPTGYIATKRNDPERDHFDSYLRYLNPVDQRPFSNPPVASTWEFCVVTPYTD